MKKIAVLLFIILGNKTVGYTQDFALKTNGLYWATTTLNMGVEKAISNQVTLEADVAYNPWTFREDKKMHLLLVQPEMKYWLCEKYEGHFVGIHLHGAQFYGGFGSKLYDGYLAGGGVTYGYDWILSPHCNLRQPSVWDTPTSGTSKALTCPASSARKRRTRTISVLPRLHYH